MSLISRITDGFVRAAEEFRQKATYDHVSQVADDLAEYLENAITNSQAWVTDNYATVHEHPYRADTWVPGWTDVTGKPTTFNPSAHTHPYRADTWLPPNDHVATTVVVANGLSISGQQISMGTPWTGNGYLTSITKAMIEAQLTGSITSHTHAYLSSFTETDPVFTAWNKTTGISILNTQISNWTAATAGFVTGTPWTGNGYLTGITKAMIEAQLTGAITSHTHGYLSSFTETDPVFTAWNKTTGISILNTQISNWATATAGFVTGTPWTGMGYLTAINKAMVEAVLTGSITSHTHAYLASITKAQVEAVLTGAITSHTHAYDNYGSWGLTADGGVTTLSITSGSPVGFVGLGGSVVTRSGGSIYVDSPALGTGSTNAAYGNHTHSGVYQTLDADLTAIAALAGTSGLLKKTAANTWTLDTTSYLTALPGHSIGTHSDVFLSGLTNGQILLYWSGYWSNKTLADSGIQAAITTGTDQQYLKGDLTLGTFAHTHNYEPTLGNPGTNGYVLSSTSGGTRSWIAQSGGIADAASNSLIYGRYNATWVNLASSFAALNGSGTTDFSMQAGIFGTGGYSSAWSIKNETGTLSFAYAGSSKATLTSAGVFTAAELYRGSSRELKYDIQPFTVNAMQMLNNVLITDYKLKSNDQYAIGFIAEDTHPWLSGIHQKAHSFGNHLALLTKAIQEEDDKITVLQNQVIALQNQVLVLQNNQKTN